MTAVDTLFERAAGGSGGPIVWLDDRGARHAPLVGAKAANLATASAAGLPLLPGFVITMEVARTLTDRCPGDLHSAWAALSQGGAWPLIVRSSSVAEDGERSSMAGRFTSVLDVRGWTAFLEAVRTVVESGRAAGDAPMAVLVQPMLEARFGGVLFGLDPVTGRRDRLVVAAVRGGPDLLVSGVVQGSHLVLSRRGRVRSSDGADPALPSRLRHQLAKLAARAESVFGAPQDLEWATDGCDRLVLLQARPVTAHGTTVAATGPVLGPGPVAETLPGVLAELEQDLWAEPLRQGLTEALALVGSASRARLRKSPVVAVVDGQVAADLDLIGAWRPRRRWLARLDPRPPARRLAASWRVGRLRAAFPLLADRTLQDVDQALLDVPALDGLDSRQLLGLLTRSREALVALHGHEVLAGLLLGAPHGGVTGAGVALAALAAGRVEGLDDEEIVAADPVVLALVPPRIAASLELPAGPVGVGTHADETGEIDENGLRREALRLRARWVQELLARAAWQLGLRLTAAGALARPSDVRHLRHDELADLVAGRPAPSDLRARALAPDPAPLPAAFRVGIDGSPVAVPVHDGPAAGQGAGGGRGVGVVVHGVGEPPPDGAVLVVRTLDPSLAPHLGRLRGLVAETGSVLSHLAILARESGVPTVVGFDGATDRLPEGSLAFVDGVSGDAGLVPVSAPLEQRREAS